MKGYIYAILFILALTLVQARPAELHVTGRAVNLQGAPIADVQILVAVNGDITDRLTSPSGLLDLRLPFANVSDIVITLTGPCTEQKSIYFIWSTDFQKVQYYQSLFDDPRVGMVLPNDQRHNYSTTGNISLGDITVYPFVGIAVDSDDLVRPSVFYTSKYGGRQVGGTIQSNYYKDHSNWGLSH